MLRMVSPQIEDQKGDPARISFGLYEVDLRAGELWRAGFRVRLQSQPFKVLTALLARPGEVVTREDLQTLVWGRNTTVDFDHSLGTAINKLREALGDSADNPRFIETLAKRGYRFIAPVSTSTPSATRTGLRQTEVSLKTSTPILNQSRNGVTTPLEDSAGPQSLVLEASAPGSTSAPALTSTQNTTQTTPSHKWSSSFLVGSLAIALLAGLAIGIWRSQTQPDYNPLRINQVTHTSRISPGAPNMESLPAFTTDGVRLFASVLDKGEPQLSIIDINSGEAESLTVPEQLASASIEDLSRDGSRLLVRSHLSSESEQPVWIMPTTGGSAFRIGSIRAHDATWMPDGKSILFASGNELSVSTQDGSITPYATAHGRAFWMRWSPDGKLLRFTLMDPLTHTSSLWELDSATRSLHPLFKEETRSSSDCCGTWTADGSAYIFQSEADGVSDLWKIKRGSGPSTASRLTNGPLSYGSPVASPSGHAIFFLGLDTRSELQRLSADNRNEFAPEDSFLSCANRVDYSRDRLWVAWTDRDGKLWRARAADGAEKLQLTPDSMQVFLAHWSPDGHRLALMARESGKAWQIYLVGADGGTPERLLKETRNVADPGWSADGRSLVFGRESDLMGKENGSHAIEIVALNTGEVTTLPSSEGLFSPRWSPDGRFIAALSLDQRRVMLYDVATRQWRKLVESSAADPVWSADSKWLFFHATMAEKQPILKVSIPAGRVETAASLDNFRAEETADYFFVGITPGNIPLVRARLATGNLYTLSLDAP